MVLPLDLGKERLDARRARDGVVFLELQLGRDTELKRFGETGAKVSGETLQPLERRLLVGLTAEDADVNARVAKIGSDVHSRHRHEADDARVLRGLREESSDFPTDSLGDAVGPAGVTQWQQTRASAPPVPCDSTRSYRRP